MFGMAHISKLLHDFCFTHPPPASHLFLSFYPSFFLVYACLLFSLSLSPFLYLCCCSSVTFSHTEFLLRLFPISEAAKAISSSLSLYSIVSDALGAIFTQSSQQSLD